MTGRIASSDNTTLAGSILPAAGFLNSGSTFGPTTRRMTMTGTPIRNTEPHQKNSSSPPPMIGPSAVPPMKQPIQTPMAMDICLGFGNMAAMSAMVEGMIVDPATPSRARMTISISGLVEYAANIETTANAAAPIISSFLRPIRSPMFPIVMSRPATRKP